MQHTEYRGITVTDHRPSSLTCPITVYLPGFGNLGARNMEEAHAKVDAFLAYRERPAQPGEMKIIAAMPGTRMYTSSTGRNAAERARGRTRKNGKFA